MKIFDTDIVIDILRQHAPAIEWLDTLGDEEIALPGYVAMELMQGCQNKSQLNKLRKFIADFDVVWPSTETCDEALDIFAQYNLSHNLGLLDTLIGQTAVAMDAPLCTFNRKHYAVIPHLITIQPYKR